MPEKKPLGKKKLLLFGALGIGGVVVLYVMLKGRQTSGASALPATLVAPNWAGGGGVYSPGGVTTTPLPGDILPSSVTDIFNLPPVASPPAGAEGGAGNIDTRNPLRGGQPPIVTPPPSSVPSAGLIPGFGGGFDFGGGPRPTALPAAPGAPAIVMLDNTWGRAMGGVPVPYGAGAPTGTNAVLAGIVSDSGIVRGVPAVALTTQKPPNQHAA